MNAKTVVLMLILLASVCVGQDASQNIPSIDTRIYNALLPHLLADWKAYKVECWADSFKVYTDWEWYNPDYYDKHSFTNSHWFALPDSTTGYTQGITWWSRKPDATGFMDWLEKRQTERSTK